MTFDSWREGGADCPSELRLDALVAGDLQSESAAEVEAHLAGCPHCRARVDERRRGFAAFEEVDPRRLLAAIRTRADERRPSFWRKLGLALVPFAVAAAALLLIIRLGPFTADPGLRAKGGLGLHVFRQAGERAERLVSGDRVRAGDHLRFAADLPSAGQVVIVGVEASGALFTAWPLDPGTPTERAAGHEQSLPGAVSLDESQGRETLWLVLCRDKPSCASGGPERAPSCGKGCQLSPFVLDKGP